MGESRSRSSAIVEKDVALSLWVFPRIHDKYETLRIRNTERSKVYKIRSCPQKDRNLSLDGASPAKATQ